MRLLSNLKSTVRFYLVAFGAFVLGGVSALAHQGLAHHTKAAGDVSDVSQSTKEQATLRQISESYTQTVKPIFDQKCLDCHGGKATHPWYHKIPGVRQMMDRDVAEATEHMDMSKGFPFGGHGTPSEDLEAIAKVINDQSMPPFSYQFVHPGSSIRGAERQAVLGWVENSQKLLKETQPQK